VRREIEKLYSIGWNYNLDIHNVIIYRITTKLRYLLATQVN